MLDKRLVREALGVKLTFVLSIGLGLGISILAVLQARYLAQVIAMVFLQGQDFNTVRHLISIILGLVLFRAVLQTSTEVLAHEGAAEVKEDLRLRLLDHLMQLGPVYTRGERTGEIVSVFAEGIEALEDYLARYMPQLVLAALIPVMILAFVFPLDLTAGLILLFTAPLIPLFMILIGKLADKKAQAQWLGLGRMSAHFLDVLQGLATLKVFGRSKSQLEVIARVSNNFRTTTLGVLRIAFLSALILEFLATISTALIAVSLGLHLVNGSIPFQDVFFLLLLAPELYLPLRALGVQFHAGLSGVNAANRIFEILGIPAPGIQSNEEGEFSGSAKIKPPLHVSVERVDYGFENSAPVLAGVSFELRPGERVALVGVSGAGKSTIAQLLLGFIQPNQGLVRINGIPLGRVHSEEWRQQIAFIPQNPYLFHGTIKENILFGQIEASREDVVKSAELAGAHEFIARLPQGYETQVGEGGVRLSGGQVQRIAIARAFLKDAPLLILDEATTGLDATSERIVQEALVRLSKGRTVLFIAHRLSTVCQADRIMVLADGKIAEQGKHQELIDQKGLYSSLVKEFGGERICID